MKNFVGNKAELPKFQKLQQQMTQFIRNPQQKDYRGNEFGGLSIEKKRLDIYQELFFNNIYTFIESIFPVLNSIFGSVRMKEVVRKFLQHHKSTTPLFHELGGEFLQFLQSEYKMQDDDPEWIIELAHYEWIELELMVAEEAIDLDHDWVMTSSLFNKPDFTINIGQDSFIKISPLARVLIYNWPVHQISMDNARQVKPCQTYLLVYRDLSNKVNFINLTPLMAQLLWIMQDNNKLTFNELWGLILQNNPDKEIVDKLNKLKLGAFSSLKGLMEEDVIYYRHDKV